MNQQQIVTDQQITSLAEALRGELELGSDGSTFEATIRSWANGDYDGPRLDANTLNHLLASRVRRNGWGDWPDGYQAAANDVARWLAEGPTNRERSRILTDAEVSR